MNTRSVAELSSETREEPFPVVHSRSARGVEMFIAVNSILRGPALGGCRWQPYPDREAALREALGLASAMTRKAALADLPLGGGKAVVIGDPAERTRGQLRAFGDFVESLGGTYITAEDMGTAPADMAVIRERTGHVIGLPPDLGGCGDPSPHTAEGVFLAIEAALGYLGKRVEAARIAVQGVGAVGQDLVRRLLRAGASVAAADVDSEKLRTLPEEVEPVEVREIARLRCDVFAPCGPPGVLHRTAVRELFCHLVCGAANNPLSGPEAAEELASRRILYVPDFLANAGGLIHLAVAREGGTAEDTRRHLAVIPRNFETVMELVEKDGVNPLEAAEFLVEERLSHPPCAPGI
jgi:leucine dehydrogenase